MVETPQFNVLEHNLVPEHRLLSKEEAHKVLDKLRITKDHLPKIRKSDACIKVLENVYGKPIDEGSIIEVIRKSETAEVAVAYRLVRG
ncbi:MAG TPA: DNA-directed RNA polymerase subunit H [Methanomassiliicoccales archaeon]|nr:DNA-directed RNA polymerase subunit H [Methanomassiliicoccales archaeon]